MFDTFKSSNVSIGMMDNHARCKAIGIGSRKVKMFDGVVRTLINVRYVPDSKKNLLSLSTFDSLRYRYSIKDGGMKITKVLWWQ